MKYGAVWDSAAAALQQKRFGQLFALYWLISLSAGVLLPPGKEMGYLSTLAIDWTRPFDGLHQLVSVSFDPGYVAVFVIFTLTLAMLLFIFSWMWIPFGRPNRFPSFKRKLVLFLSIGVMSVFLFLLLTAEQSEHDLTHGKTALLYFSAQTRIGVITAVNALFGFLLLCVLIAVLEGLKSPVSGYVS